MPVLNYHLDNLLEEEPCIFVDENIETGAEWPVELASALKKSCCLLAVWTPPYFRSRWCLAEWQSMREREKLLRAEGEKSIPPLIYPIVFGDGDAFPEDAKRTKWKLDLKRYAYPYHQFRDSPMYLEFHDTVGDIAKEITEHLSQVPKWSADWPSITPHTKHSIPTIFPRI